MPAVDAMRFFFIVLLIIGAAPLASGSVDAPPRPYGYAGREPDPGGLLYCRNRYYDPGSGLYTQRDPLGLAADLNDYVHVAANPVNWRDPSGLFAEPHGRWLLPARTRALVERARNVSLRAQLSDDEAAVMSIFVPRRIIEEARVVVCPACFAAFDKRPRVKAFTRTEYPDSLFVFTLASLRAEKATAAHELDHLNEMARKGPWYAFDNLVYSPASAFKYLFSYEAWYRDNPLEIQARSVEENYRALMGRVQKIKEDLRQGRTALELFEAGGAGDFRQQDPGPSGSGPSQALP